MKTSKILKFFISAAFAFSIGQLAFAVKLPTTTVGGQTRCYYDVQPRETIYGIALKLGLTREQIVEWNPSVAEGLKAGMRLYFPTSAFGEEAASSKARETHVVKPRETVYGISKQYGMSVDRLIELNPDATDGLKAGDRLTVEVPRKAEKADAKPATEEAKPAATEAAGAHAPAVVANPTEDKTVPTMSFPYVIRPGETLYGIATSNGITVEDLLAANPGLNAMNYKSGTRIIVPMPATHQSAATPPVVFVDDDEDEASSDETAEATPLEAAASDATTEAVTEAEAEEPSSQSEHPTMPYLVPDTVRIAVVMPFLLEEEHPARTAQLYTEFFRGMVLAAERMRYDDGLPVAISAFDTKGSAEVASQLMERPEMASMTMIIVPDDEEQVAGVSEGASEQTWVFNTFAVKDTSYVDTPRMIQANIPHTRMYARAIEAFDERIPDATPVFVSRIEGQADKQPFVAMLRQHFEEQGRPFEEITFRNVLSLDDLESLRPDSTSYVFIPITGSRNEFGKLTGALKRLQERGGSQRSVQMFGYPEWVTFRGDYFNDLCDLNATIYSRFYDVEDSADSVALQEAYQEAYGRKMFDAVPRQGVLGYDTATYAIRAARALAQGAELPLEFDGLQSALSLVPVADGGLYNDCLLIVTFRPGGKIEKSKI